jgi:dsRNA-specific ribonuclease
MSSSLGIDSNDISALQIVSVRNGWGNPVYRELPRAGSEHNPTFTIEVQIHDKLYRGHGPNKDAAKAMAASAALRALDETGVAMSVLATAAPTSDMHPVNKLQEIYSKQGLKLPQYVTLFDPSASMFCCTVTICNPSEPKKSIVLKGVATRKADAKLNAAAKAVEHLALLNDTRILHTQAFPFERVSSSEVSQGDPSAGTYSVFAAGTSATGKGAVIHKATSALDSTPTAASDAHGSENTVIIRDIVTQVALRLQF